MKNILFIGPYRQSDGWGEQARAYAMALKATGHNICLRAIYMGGAITNNIPADIIEMERDISHKCEKFDIIIQNVLPQLLEFSNDSDVKNIALCAFETAQLEHTLWPRYINKVDELWVASEQEADDIKASGVTIPIRSVPAPIDTDKFNRDYDNTSWLKLGLGDKFVFYFIGEYIPRKNLQALITAFHREFQPNEPVELLIKTNRGGHNHQQLTALVRDDIIKQKEALTLYNNIDRYKPEWVITEFMSEDHLCALHQTCNCFVMPSRGEACCRPLLDAQGFGNPCIVTKNTGMTSYVDSVSGWLVPSERVPVMSTEHPLPYLYTSHELWSEINIIELQRSMREAFIENGLKQKQRTANCKENIKQFSYNNIAERMNILL